LYDHISQLAQYIADKKKTLEFVIPHVKINRDDDLLIREKILSMSPEERKKLGINKSTLWYLKKNISSKNKIKIYDKVLQKMKDTMS
jgi:CRISPR-associated protein Cas1